MTPECGERTADARREKAPFRMAGVESLPWINVVQELLVNERGVI